MSILLQAIGINKWYAYILIAIAALSAIGVALQRVRSGGAKDEKMKAAERALERMKQNAQIKLSVERTSTDSARAILLNRYSR